MKKIFSFLLLFFAVPGLIFFGPVGVGETLVAAIEGRLNWWYPICWAAYWIFSIIVVFHESYKKEV